MGTRVERGGELGKEGKGGEKYKKIDELEKKEDVERETRQRCYGDEMKVNEWNSKGRRERRNNRM